MKKPINKRMTDPKYLLSVMDLEEELLERSTVIAQRMVAALAREKRGESNIDIDALADKIVKKIEGKINIRPQFITASEAQESSSEGFKLDDKPTVIESHKYDIKGKIGTKTTSKESTSDALDALSALDI